MGEYSFYEAYIMQECVLCGCFRWNLQSYPTNKTNFDHGAGERGQRIWSLWAMLMLFQAGGGLLVTRANTSVSEHPWKWAFGSTKADEPKLVFCKASLEFSSPVCLARVCPSAELCVSWVWIVPSSLFPLRVLGFFSPPRHPMLRMSVLEALVFKEPCFCFMIAVKWQQGFLNGEECQSWKRVLPEPTHHCPL